LFDIINIFQISEFYFKFLTIYIYSSYFTLFLLDLINSNCLDNWIDLFFIFFDILVNCFRRILFKNIILEKWISNWLVKSVIWIKRRRERAWNVQYNPQHNPLWNLFTRHTLVSNLPLYVFRVRPTNTFHLSIQKEMAWHAGSRIASSRSLDLVSAASIASLTFTRWSEPTLTHARLPCYRGFDEYLILCLN